MWWEDDDNVNIEVRSRTIVLECSIVDWLDIKCLLLNWALSTQFKLSGCCLVGDSIWNVLFVEGCDFYELFGSEFIEIWIYRCTIECIQRIGTLEM